MVCNRFGDRSNCRISCGYFSSQFPLLPSPLYSHSYPKFLQERLRYVRCYHWCQCWCTLKWHQMKWCLHLGEGPAYLVLASGLKNLWSRKVGWWQRVGVYHLTISRGDGLGLHNQSRREGFLLWPCGFISLDRSIQRGHFDSWGSSGECGWWHPW
jgi:hypothetical protein